MVVVKRVVHSAAGIIITAAVLSLVVPIMIGGVVMTLRERGRDR